MTTSPRRRSLLTCAIAMGALAAFAPSAGAAAPKLVSATVPNPATTQTVAVTVEATDDKAVTRMRFATESGDFAAWQPFARTAPFTLTAGLGARGVFVQVMDAGFETSNILYIKTVRTAGAPNPPAPPANGVVNGTNGNDALTGTRGTESIFGLLGNDTLDWGGDGGDILDGGDGMDQITGCCEIRGGTGDDIVNWRTRNDYGGGCMSGANGDYTPCEGARIDCGDGEDFVFGNTYSGVWPTTGANCEHTFTTRHPYAYPTPRAARTGSEADDRLNGSPTGDTLLAGGGNDQLFGNAAGADEHDVDLLSGGAGNDTIDTGAGQERFGNDLSSPTFVFAGAGDDVIIVRTQAKVDCGAGYDIVYRAASAEAEIGGYFQNSLEGCEEIVAMA